MRLLILSFFILIVAITMSMVGKGGGNFYVVILTIAGVSMKEAATTGQFILFFASLSAMLIFNKKKNVLWSLAIVIGGTTALSALAGGYFSYLFSGFALKMIFSGLLATAGIIMLLPVKESVSQTPKTKIGFWNIRGKDAVYTVNLWVGILSAVMIGFASGMVGVSGGSFLVPLMVLACGIPMYTAVGTASVLIATTALMGFTGHIIHGEFNPFIAIPLAVVTVIGGYFGGKFGLKTKPKNLKKLFAVTNWIAAGFMLINGLMAFYK